MKKKGFTLIEMLIVIIIIGILAATLIPRIGGARNRANDTARIADIRSISTALIQYQLDNPKYPKGFHDKKAVNGTGLVGNAGQGVNACSLSGVSALLDANYGLGGVLPADPVSRYQYNYRLLDSRDDHFVVCAKLSDGSKAGNATQNLAYRSECEDFNDGTTVTDNDKYSVVLSKLTDEGDYYCYVG